MNEPTNGAGNVPTGDAQFTATDEYPHSLKDIKLAWRKSRAARMFKLSSPKDKRRFVLGLAEKLG
jgi:hypothetical protein